MAFWSTRRAFACYAFTGNSRLLHPHPAPRARGLLQYLLFGIRLISKNHFSLPQRKACERECFFGWNSPGNRLLNASRLRVCYLNIQDRKCNGAGEESAQKTFHERDDWHMVQRPLSFCKLWIRLLTFHASQLPPLLPLSKHLVLRKTYTFLQVSISAK